MVFPVETEERGKHRALTICQDHLRKVVEVTRKIPQLVDFFVQGDKASVKHLHAEIIKGEEEVSISRHSVVQELAEIGAILINREDFLKFTSLTSEIVDFCEGIAFRLLVIIDRGWKAPSDIKKGLVNLSNAMLETIVKLRETVIVLQYGSTKTAEKAREVEAAERIVDDLYRELEVKVISSHIEIPVLILLRDVLKLMEDTADKVEDATDVARILAFAM